MCASMIFNLVTSGSLAYGVLFDPGVVFLLSEWQIKLD